MTSITYAPQVDSDTDPEYQDSAETTADQPVGASSTLVNNSGQGDTYEDDGETMKLPPPPEAFGIDTSQDYSVWREEWSQALADKRGWGTNNDPWHDPPDVPEDYVPGTSGLNPNGMDFENRMTGGAISSPDPRMMAALPVGKPDYGLDELDLEAGNTVGSEAALAQAKAYIEAAEARA